MPDDKKKRAEPGYMNSEMPSTQREALQAFFMGQQAERDKRVADAAREYVERLKRQDLAEGGQVSRGAPVGYYGRSTGSR